MKRTFNDFVEDIHVQLILADQRYNDLLSATDDSQTIEGSMFIDDCLAARMISDHAKLNCHVEVANANIATIRRALHVVLRRYGASRKERRAALTAIPKLGA